MIKEEDKDEMLMDLIMGMRECLGRLPTEEEVYTFIFGNIDEKLEILRKGKGGF